MQMRCTHCCARKVEEGRLGLKSLLTRVSAKSLTRDHMICLKISRKHELYFLRHQEPYIAPPKPNIRQRVISPANRSFFPMDHLQVTNSDCHVTQRFLLCFSDNREERMLNHFTSHRFYLYSLIVFLHVFVETRISNVCQELSIVNFLFPICGS